MEEATKIPSNFIFQKKKRNNISFLKIMFKPSKAGNNLEGAESFQNFLLIFLSKNYYYYYFS